MKILFSLLSNSKKSLQRILKWYSQKIETYPLVTKGLTSGFLAGSGDISCQYLVSLYQTKQSTSLSKTSTFELDYKRTFRFAFLGCILIAPTLHVWYAILSKYVKTRAAVSTNILRTVLDQFFFAPMFLPTYLTSLMILEGRNFDSYIIPKLKRDTLQIIMVGWYVIYSKYVHYN